MKKEEFIMENKDFDDLDKILYKEFNQNFKVTSKVSKRIDDTINMIRHKQKFSYKVIDSLKKVAVVSVSAVTLFGGYCFAKMIIENYFYTENNGIETAASNGYIYTINSDYSVSNNNKLKVDNILMDDFTLNLSLSLELDNIDYNNIKDLIFSDILITDDSKNILNEVYFMNTITSRTSIIFIKFNNTFISRDASYVYSVYIIIATIYCLCRI